MKESQEQKKSSPLINTVNDLQEKYQIAIQGLSEEEKEALQYTELFYELYEELSCYVEHTVEQCIYKCGVKTGDLDVQGVKELVLDEVFGLNGKTPLYESFQPKNNAKFTTYCYAVVEKNVLKAVEKERDLLLDLTCLKKPELEEIKQNKKKWGLHEIRKRMNSFEEVYETVTDRILSDPQKVYEEQCYLQKRVEKLKAHMEIVAEGPEIKERSTSARAVYSWVGGSVGAYLSPVAKSEWQDMNLEEDEAYKTASLIQETALGTAIRLAAEDVSIVIKEKVKDVAEVQQIEASVTKKLAEQMEDSLRTERKAAEGGSSKEFRALAQQYYKKLSKKYRASVAADAEFDLAWTWQVIFGLTPEEAAWLFVREMYACVPVLKFDWKKPFKELMKNEMYSGLFVEVTAEKTTKTWPKAVRSKVFAIQNQRENSYHRELLVTNASEKREGAAEIGL